MKTNIAMLCAALLAATAAMAAAKTATGTIPVTAQITSSNTVSAFLTGGGEVTTAVTNDAYKPAPSGATPIIRVGFQSDRSWFFVKRVTWDKAHHFLTIDF